jgi:hypothetical protein
MSWIAASAALLVACGVGLAACGGGDGNSTAATGNSVASTAPATSAAVKAADAAVAKFEQPQPAIQLPLLSKRPSKGIKLGVVTCPLPICVISFKTAASVATKYLGWKVQLYQTQLTPESYVATWQRMLRDKPDAIEYAAIFPNQVISKQLAQVKAQKIPAVGLAPAGDQPDAAGPMIAAYSSTPMFAHDGQLMGDVVVADAKGAADTGFITDPSLKPQFGPVQDQFTKSVKAAGGKVSVLQVSSQGIGKTIPAAVVSFVQRHPEIKYLAFALNDFTVGVPEALKAAGVAAKVKIVSRAPQLPNLKAIADGDQYAAVADEDVAGGLRGLDGLARALVGDPLDPCCRFPDGWHQIYRKNTVDPSKPSATPGVPDSFLKAWRIQQ